MDETKPNLYRCEDIYCPKLCKFRHFNTGYCLRGHCYCPPVTEIPEGCPKNRSADFKRNSLSLIFFSGISLMLTYSALHNIL